MYVVQKNVYKGRELNAVVISRVSSTDTQTLQESLSANHLQYNQLKNIRGNNQSAKAAKGNQMDQRNKTIFGVDRNHDATAKLDTHGVDTSNMRKRLEDCRLYPDIILVGFEKCGTMTLRWFFGAHPEIFLTHDLHSIPYFDTEPLVSFDTYTKNMPCTPANQLKLEKISCTASAINVFDKIPNVKLIAIVREPVERAMSQYVHFVAKGWEKSNTFDNIINTLLVSRGNKTNRNSWLFGNSTYIDLLEPWLQTFGRDKIHIVNGDNFVKHPAYEFNKIEKFLNISQYFRDDQFVYNPRKKFYCLKGTGCPGKNKGRPHPKMTNTTRRRLQTYFKPFNEKLFLALGQRFSWNY